MAVKVVSRYYLTRKICPTRFLSTDCHPEEKAESFHRPGHTCLVGPQSVKAQFQCI